MDNFIYTSTPSRVIFGQGKVSTLPQEAEALGVSKCLILCTKFQTKEAEMLTKLLGDKAMGIFDNATMHTPISITNEALELAKSLDADSVVSIGGGSTIGLGKAISFKTKLPHICIPTTYAGSEMTPILGQTVDGKKTTESHPDIKPNVVIYDVDLTLTLPVEMSLTSSVNAIAHAGKRMLHCLSSLPLLSHLNAKLTMCKTQSKRSTHQTQTPSSNFSPKTACAPSPPPSPRSKQTLHPSQHAQKLNTELGYALSAWAARKWPSTIKSAMCLVAHSIYRIQIHIQRFCLMR